MSSLIKSSLRRLSLVLVAFTFTTSLYAATTAEQVGLKVDGEKVDTIGRKGCKSPDNVEILLSNQLKTKNDFRAVHKTVKKETDLSKAKGEDICENKIAIGRTAETFTKSTPTIPLRKLLTDVACQDEGVSEGHVLCIYEGTSVGDELVAYAVYRIDTALAKIDSISDRTAVNGEVRFTVNITGKNSSSIKIETCFGKTSDGDINANPKECPKTHRIHGTNSKEVSITGLEPVEYSFKVRLNDPKDGESEWFKDTFTETPIPVAFPFGNYNGKGGEMEFSCQQGQGRGTLILFALTLLGLLLLRVRARHARTGLLSFLLPLTLCVLVPKDVRAELGQVNIGLLGSMYRPDLDNETLASGEKVFPFYKCFFRKKTSDQNGPINPLMGAEVDVHLWDGFGSLQFGLGLGYTFVNGHAVKLNADGTPDCDSPVTNATATLHMYQVRPQLTYAFDYFAEDFPLVPYVRGAMIGHGYIFRNGSQTATAATGRDLKPNGFRFGYQAAVGLMLMLDFLEPGAMHSARGQGFLQHVFLKGELSYSKIDSFGRRGYQFTPKDVMGTSLPLMWTFGLVFELP